MHKHPSTSTNQDTSCTRSASHRLRRISQKCRDPAPVPSATGRPWPGCPGSSCAAQRSLRRRRRHRCRAGHWEWSERGKHKPHRLWPLWQWSCVRPQRPCCDEAMKRCFLDSFGPSFRMDDEKHMRFYCICLHHSTRETLTMNTKIST